MGAKMYVLIALPLVMLAAILGVAFWAAKSKSPRAVRMFNLFGMRRADEMEQMIQYKATSLAYMVAVFVLLGINFYEVFVQEQSLPLSNLAILAGLLTQCIATLVLRHKSTEGDEEYAQRPLWLSLIIPIAFGVAAALIGMGVCILVMMW